MSKVNVFNFASLNGYFEGPQGDISWSHDAEENDYATQMLDAASTLLFGRVTYELMASFWPTPMAMRNSPNVAEGMNRADKVVFSRTLSKADWNNTRLVKGDAVEEVRKLKQTQKSMTLLGSGSLLTQLAEHGLIDEYEIMVHPVALGAGTPMFKGIKQNLRLRLTNARTFKSGNVLLSYQPA